VIYQIQTARPTYALRHTKVTVCENAQSAIKILSTQSRNVRFSPK